MAQRWSPPGYPEEPYYEEPAYYAEETYDNWEGGSPLQRFAPFATGSCLTLVICLCAFGCFVVFWTGAWFGGDAVLQALGDDQAAPEAGGSPAQPGPSFAEAPPFNDDEPRQAVEPTFPPAPVPPAPTSPPVPPTSPPVEPAAAGTSQETAARIDQPLASNAGLEITVLDVRRDLTVEIAPEPGKEFVFVSLKLRSLRPPNEFSPYDPLDFLLFGGQGGFYPPDPQADNGRRLVAGELPGEGVIDGDLIFQVAQGEGGLFLVWNAGPEGSPLWFNLEQ
ncbi:MAG: DUF4352 domain-containing protein [Anaerolineae bacterium]